jgi:hypothetical protein
MLTTDAALYLPISDRILRAVLNDAQNLETALSGLAVPQIAALILLQYLPRLTVDGPLSPDRILVETIATGNAEVKSAGLPAFAASALQMLTRAGIQTGCKLLPDFRIMLLDDDDLSQRHYLTAAGDWDRAFHERHRARLSESLQRLHLPTGETRTLTAEQSGVLREFKAQADDHLHVQGYAGTGKSSLLRALVTAIEPTGANVLVLAERQVQLTALLSGMERLEHVHARTFNRLMGEVVPDDRTLLSQRRMHLPLYAPAPIPDEAIVQHLCIRQSGKFKPAELVKVVRRVVASYCYSGDAEFELKHMPYWYAISCDAATQQVVLRHARELWNELVKPTTRYFRPPVRGYHRVKWAALNGWQIPRRYTHVLIDECHDLAKSMLQIIDCSPQAVISFGDEYQHLYGRPQQRSTFVRQREVTHSVRSGQLLEPVVNPIIAAHPAPTKAPFHGNRLQHTQVVDYAKAQIPAEPAVILAPSYWGLFEWAQRLADAPLDFALLSNRARLTMFVADCIELYREGTRPRVGELFRFTSWEAVAHHFHDCHGFQRIDRMLRKGYGHADWTRTCGRLVEYRPHAYALGLVEDVRNREFDAVMLAPETADRIWSNERATLASTGSGIYVAVTRAVNRLIVPTQLRNWIEEISAISQRSRMLDRD